MGADLFCALVLAILATIIWFILLRNFTLSDELFRAKKDRTGMIRFLNRFTNSFARLQELGHARDLIGHYIAEVLEADSLCIFSVVEEDGKRFLKPTSVVGMFPPLQPTSEYIRKRASHLHRAIKQSRLAVDRDNVFGRITIDRKPVLHEHEAMAEAEIRNSLYGDKVDSVMIVPMIMENKVLGIICAVNSLKAGYFFNEDDLKLLESLSAQAALAHEFLGIYLQLRDQQRISKELEVAEQIQKSLLPSEAPQWGDFKLIPYTRSAKEVAGDYYDFVEIDEDRLLVLVADASGKGIPACMIMAMCRSIVHALVQKFTDLNTMLIELNKILYKDTDGSHFITMAGCLIDKRTNQIEYCRAGHTELLVKSPVQGVRMLMPDGPALGLLPGDFVESFETMTLDATADNQFLIFTDGITEATNAQNDEFGLNRLMDTWERVIDEQECEKVPKTLARLVDEFTEYAAPSDDRTILYIERVVS